MKYINLLMYLVFFILFIIFISSLFDDPNFPTQLIAINIIPCMYLISVVFIIIFRKNINKINVVLFTIFTILIFYNIDNYFRLCRPILMFKIVKSFLNNSGDLFQHNDAYISNIKNLKISVNGEFKNGNIYVANHHNKNNFSSIVLFNILHKYEINIITELNNMFKFFTGIKNGKSGMLCPQKSQKGNNYDSFKEIIKNLTTNGEKCLVFANNINEKLDNTITVPKKLRTGFFSVAKQLNVPIIPVYFEWNRNGNLLFNKYTTEFIVKIGEPLDLNLTSDEMALKTRNFLYETGCDILKKRSLS